MFVKQDDTEVVSMVLTGEHPCAAEAGTNVRQEKTAEEVYRSIVDNSAQGLAVNQDFHFVHVNQAFADIFGYSVKEMLALTSDEVVGLIHCDDRARVLKFHSDRMAGKPAPSRYEFRGVRKDGSVVFLEMFNSRIDFRGSPAEQIALMDITAKRQSEHASRESEEKFRTFFEEALDAIFVADAETGVLIDCNHAATELVGRTKKELIGKHQRMLHPQQEIVREGMSRTFRQHLEDKRGQVLETQVITKKGEIKEVAIKANLIELGGKKVLLGVFRDVTNRKKAEEALRESEEKFRNLAEQSPNMIFINKKGRVVYANRKAEEAMGYRREEFYSQEFDFVTLIAPESRELVESSFIRHMSGADVLPYEYKLVTKDGRMLDAILTTKMMAYGGEPAILGTITDITERKQMEKALRESEENYRNISKKMSGLLKSSAVLLSSTDLHKRLRTILEVVCEQGWKRAVITLKDGNLETTDVVAAGLTEEEEGRLRSHQPSGEVMRKRLSSMFEQYRLGEFYYLPWSDPLVQEQFKHAIPSKMKKEETVDWNPDDLLFIPLRLPDGQVVGIMSMDDPKDGRRPTRESLAPLELFAHQAAVAIENAILIQQVKEYAQRLEEKVDERTADLRRSEEKLQSIFTASPDAIAATDLKGNIIECNEQTVKMHGYSSREELIGKSALELFAKQDHQKAKENLEKTFEHGYVKTIEYMLVTKDGREFPAELSASVVRDASGNPMGFVAVTRDITERKRLEQQLFKSERLAAIGQLAAMIGHDLRNPLTGITGAAYYLKTKLSGKMDDKTREMVNIIEKDIAHSNKIIDDLLEYSREIKLELTEVTPNTLTCESLSLLKIPKRVKVVDLTEDKPVVMVDLEKLKRAFVNIIKNAVDAMPKGGTLTVRSRQVGRSLEIAVSDTGVGIPKDSLQRIFTPLFTSKAKGMGFGLAISKRFVDAHGGRISVESVAGEGSTFTIVIPIKRVQEGGEKVWVDMPESSLSTMMKE